MDQPNQPKRLLRSRDDRFIGGVAAGLANYFSIDPALVRIAFVLSLAFGGIGLIAYLLLLASMPVQGPEDDPLPPIPGRRRNLMIAGTVLIGFALVVGLDSGGFAHWVFGFGPGPLFGILLWSAVLLLAIWLGAKLLENRSPDPPATRPDVAAAGRSAETTVAASPTQNAPTTRMAVDPDEAADTAPGRTGPEPDRAAETTEMLPEAAGEWPTEVMAGRTGGQPSGPAPAPGTGSRIASIVGRVTLVVAVAITALTLLSLLALLAAWVTAQFGSLPMALLLVVLGGSMILTAVQGRRQLSLWLLVSAVAVAVPMAVITLADLRIDGPYGSVTETPVRTADIPADGYELAAGRMVVDLRKLPFKRGQVVPLKVRSGLGLTTVIVPDRVCVAGRVAGTAGVSDVRGREASGVDIAHQFNSSVNASPRLKLAADFKVGMLEVIDATDWKKPGSYDRHGARRDDLARSISNPAASRNRAELACIEAGRQDRQRDRN